MRLLFLHRDLPPDSYTGVAIQVHRLANALVRMGHEVTVLSLSSAPEDALYRVSVISPPGPRAALSRGPLKRLALPLACRRLSLDGYDAVHVHGDGAFLRLGGNCLRTFYGTAALEARHARSLKGALAQTLSHWMEKREARKFPLSVAISGHVREHLPEVSQVIPCMLSAAPPASPPAKSTRPSLLYLGSRGTRKNGEQALDAYRKLRLEFPELRLDYVGPPGDVAGLRRACAGRPEWEGLILHTRLDQTRLASLYARSWIYLCLSSYEGFGVPLVEAMAAGCAVVSADHPGSREVVRPGWNGLVGRPGDAPALAERLLRDGGLRANLARNGLEHARAFSPEVVAERYCSLYAALSRRLREAACR